MKVSYTVKFQMNKQYEMHIISFELDSNDLSEEDRSMSCFKQLVMMQQTLLIQGILAQRAKGYLTGEQATKECEEVKSFYARYDRFLSKTD